MRGERRGGEARVRSEDVVTVQADVLLPGPAATAPALALTAPISFWGGVDPKTGAVADPRHPEYGQRVSGKILFVTATVGSSSAAAILLELVHGKCAPAAIVLHEPDAILLLGLIVAKEMGWPVPIALRLDRKLHSQFQNHVVTVAEDGRLDMTTDA
jgi:predicted aconitase with swiveling domain